jgi:hypothetical protein
MEEKSMKVKIMNMCDNCKDELKRISYLCKDCHNPAISGVYAVGDNKCLEAKSASECKLIEFVDRCKMLCDAVCNILNILSADQGYKKSKTLLSAYKWKPYIYPARLDGEDWWVKSVIVEFNMGNQRMEYGISCKLDNYCSANRPHLISCLFDIVNAHEVRNVGYIQFVETNNPSKKAKKDSRNDFATPTVVYKDGKKWERCLPGDNDLLNVAKANNAVEYLDQDARIGEVKPLNFCDEPIFAVKGYPCKRHLHVLDFFEYGKLVEYIDNNGNLIQNSKIVELVDAFVSWIEAVERLRGTTAATP